MSGEAWLYLFAVLINAVNLFLQVFFTIMYSDLEWYVKISLFKTHLFTFLLPSGTRKQLLISLLGTLDCLSEGFIYVIPLLTQMIHTLGPRIYFPRQTPC